MELRLSASGGLPSSLVTAAYFYVRFIPRDFVPQESLRDGIFHQPLKYPVFRQRLKDCHLCIEGEGVWG